MPRLFVGLELPLEVKSQLLSLQGGVKGARWQSAEQMHLTLRFIGDVDGRDAQDVLGALSQLQFTAFDAQISSVGHFGKNGFSRALWAGVTPEAPFDVLHKKIDHALVSAGFEAERRRYKPHVTLARFSNSPRRGEIEEFIHRNGLLRSETFTINEISLFLSELGHQGAHYTPIEHFEAV